MDPVTYKVIFRGELVEGFDPEMVKNDVAGLFRVTAEKIAPLFSGKPVTIRKKLDRAAALKYRTAMKKIGAICMIEPEQQTADTQSSPRTASEPDTMLCPKCRFEQPKSETCRKCGIIISRYIERSAADKEQTKSAGRTEPLSPKPAKSFFSRATTKSFLWDAGGTKRLEISWKGQWKEVTISSDGKLIGSIPDKKALSAGREFRLPDGSALTIRLTKTFLIPELCVLRNGQPLPGSDSDPLTRLKTAYGVIYFIAGLNILLGVISLFVQSKFFQQMGIGFGTIIFGLVFLALGYFTQKQSVTALILAIIIFAADGILGLVISASQGQNPNMGGIVMKIFFLISMIRGVGAIKSVKLGQV